MQKAEGAAVREELAPAAIAQPCVAGSHEELRAAAAHGAPGGHAKMGELTASRFPAVPRPGVFLGKAGLRPPRTCGIFQVGPVAVGPRQFTPAPAGGQPFPVPCSSPSSRGTAGLGGLPASREAQLPALAAPGPIPGLAHSARARDLCLAPQTVHSLHFASIISLKQHKTCR